MALNCVKTINSINRLHKAFVLIVSHLSIVVVDTNTLSILTNFANVLKTDGIEILLLINSFQIQLLSENLLLQVITHQLELFS